MWIESFPCLKEIMDFYFSEHPKPEREFQQLIARENNDSTISNESEYFISDVEVADSDYVSRFDPRFYIASFAGYGLHTDCMLTLSQFRRIVSRMKTRMPTQQEINELVGFLPRLYGEQLTPIKKWNGGRQGQDGVFIMPGPEYDPVVDEFFRVASKECWADYDYPPEEAGRMLENPDVIKTADINQIKTMLTYCVRGERFCDGHWSAMIEGGHVRRLLERLAEI
ncbi:MAG: hypothetical protein A2Z25_21430 [Planctomycetes bacterium RBG_16_55_9]|nr:MAG: hypothetical protein A2Z25_21430 [Planctomycetes bacterium RBG_16_55_9]